MRKDYGPPGPPTFDLAGRSRRQRQHDVRGRDQHIQMIGMRFRISLMRISKIVNGIDQRLASRPELINQRFKTARALGVKTEMNVKNVELIPMVFDPGWVQHLRRPPLRGNGAPRHRGIGKPNHVIAALNDAQMPDIHVVRRHGRHPHRNPGHITTAFDPLG
jgi:hypothetical protein